ncbi:CotH kinase family protein [Chitinophagales bacterium]|nr:CotH kinase family protein [Chitinophagales bacterium]
MYITRWLSLFLFFFCLSATAQNVFESKLAIIVISTPEAIPDEPKISGHMGIIYHEDGLMHSSDEPFNNYDGPIGIETRGSTSQIFFPKKPFAVETRNEDGSNNNVSIAGLPAENDWILHGPFSDKTLLRNVLAMQLARATGRYASRTRLCEVILNGDYHGVYVLMEKVKRDSDRVDIATLLPEDNSGDELTGGYIVKIDKFTGAGGNGWLSPFENASGDLQTVYQYHEPKWDAITSEQANYIEQQITNFESVLKSPSFLDS